MKKFALLAGLFVFAPMTWAQDYNIKNGLPSETYITCAEANEMAKTDSAQVISVAVFSSPLNKMGSVEKAKK